MGVWTSTFPRASRLELKCLLLYVTIVEGDLTNASAVKWGIAFVADEFQRFVKLAFV
jgi:hypothetical protein